MMKAKETEELLEKAAEPEEQAPAQRANVFAAIQRSASSSERESSPRSASPLPPPLSLPILRVQKKREKKRPPKKCCQEQETVPAIVAELPTPKAEVNVLEASIPHFNYNKELARHFKSATFSTQRDLSHYSRREQNAIKHQQRQNRPTRRYFLVHNDDVPTKLSYELRLEALGESGYYAFRPPPRMAELGESFREVVDTHDPNALQDFLAAHPFYPDALFSLAEYFRLRRNTKEANLLLEQLLFFYEQSIPYDFGLFVQSEPPRRFLDYHASTHSRLFFHTLLLFSTVLSVRGCHRAAFEYCKLMFRLAPQEDPCGAVLLLPALAFAAGEKEWLLNFARDFATQNVGPRCSLALLPHVLFATAVASDTELNGVGEAFTSAFLDRLHDGDWRLASSEPAFHAVLCLALYPQFTAAIIRETGLAAQDARAEWFTGAQLHSWPRLLSHSAFARADALDAFFLAAPPGSGRAGMQKLTAIFGHRARVAFKTPRVNLLLKAAAGFLVDAAERGTWKGAEFARAIGQPSEALRARLSPWTAPWGLERYASLIVNDFSETPSEDPALAEEPIAAANPHWLRLFFQALLPWNNVAARN